MKVFNLTDVPTPLLERLGLVRVSLRVGEETVPPGGQVDVPDRYQAEISTLVRVGAVAIGSRPAGYQPAAPEPTVKTDIPVVPPLRPLPVFESEDVVASMPIEDVEQPSSPDSSDGASKHEGGHGRKRRRG